ncbi:MAG: 1,4-alpha-glucan branching protein GlgB [Gammaproteobacteria bacterium]|nr:1,4-alpha-glucan branching protein GlgB [Gammaproteobacteria bacterium]MDH5734940.1 1,4-alpha-glucan branching protein GlgB [Gammaproteobacteria bacterium]
MESNILRLQHGEHHDPFQVLGRHPVGNKYVIRAFMPVAETVVLDGIGEMSRIEGSDLFEITITKKQNEKLPEHYQLNWVEKTTGYQHQTISPYSFLPQIGDMDLHLFGEGRHWKIYQLLGSRLVTIDGVSGCQFAVWAPNVKRVSVIGDFNGWHGLRHPMRSRGSSGLWELFIPGLHPRDSYKYEILSANGATLHKADPYARAMSLRPETTALVPLENKFDWEDGRWLEERAGWDWQHAPISIYEIHPGSWRRHSDGRFLNYKELAEQLVPYVSKLGYTHIELLPITEHPLDESWGYQVSGYYSPTSRFGSADDLRFFIDLCHQHDIGVILDWVPAHFPRDEFALAHFTGEAVYEYDDPKKGEHQDWGTLIFNYGRNEVRNFLIANALYWIEEFHIDGLRVDAVASMLYLDYSRNEGEWTANEYGGREHLEAIEFIKELNRVVHGYFPGVLTLAEESTAWPMVSRPTDMGGLGFSIKWNMGWMHDTLKYLEIDPVFRRYHHNQLSFSQLYAWTENFILPLSHDEVVHMKRSMLDKMPGDLWQKFANLRLLYAYQYAHPGKKLLFMGGEFAQWQEWSEKIQLDWALCELDSHKGVQSLVQDLNRLYTTCAPMHQLDFSHKGFQWISCDDSDHSVYAFMRKSETGYIICVFNFTPVPREHYMIGVPEEGKYYECLNTDANLYGGSNLGNSGEVSSTRCANHGFEHSIEIILPPLAAVFFTREII